MSIVGMRAILGGGMPGDLPAVIPVKRGMTVADGSWLRGLQEEDGRSRFLGYARNDMGATLGMIWGAGFPFSGELRLLYGMALGADLGMGGHSVMAPLALRMLILPGQHTKLLRQSVKLPGRHPFSTLLCRMAQTGRISGPKRDCSPSRMK